MELLDRYLHAVKFFLPQKKQDDIVRELSENLISQMEDRQEALGRPLTEAEEAEILRRHGHPMIVAAGYRRHQQLIGPVFFQIYLFALKLGLGSALLVTVVLAAINSLLYGDPVRYGVAAMLEYPGRALMVFAWTTIGFAALDMAQSHFRVRHDWDPRHLPNVINHEYRISRQRTLCELFLVSVCFVWLLLIPRMPFLLLGPVAPLVEPAAIWPLAYGPILLLTGATAALYATNFVRPYWTKWRGLARVAIQAASLLVFAGLLRADEWFVPVAAATAANDMQVERLVRIINGGFQIGFFVAAVVAALDALRELHRLNVRRRASFRPDSVISGNRPSGS